MASNFERDLERIMKDLKVAEKSLEMNCYTTARKQIKDAITSLNVSLILREKEVSEQNAKEKKEKETEIELSAKREKEMVYGNNGKSAEEEGSIFASMKPIHDIFPDSKYVGIDTTGLY